MTVQEQVGGGQQRGGAARGRLEIAKRACRYMNVQGDERAQVLDAFSCKCWMFQWRSLTDVHVDLQRSRAPQPVLVPRGSANTHKVGRTGQGNSLRTTAAHAETAVVVPARDRTCTEA